MKRTPLHTEHERLGGKFTAFAGYEMPVQYSQGIIAEHRATRTEVGAFDVSHMGEILVSGEGAFSFLQYALCNDLSKISPGKGQYTALLNEKGGVVDDLIVYQLTESTFFLCVNASNTEIVFNALNRIAKEKSFKVFIDDQSSFWGLVAVQGPKAIALLEKVAPNTVGTLKRFGITEANYQGTVIRIARTGYTGEDGVEIFVPVKELVSLWRTILVHGAIPCGLAARDSLRLEAALPLHGHELSPDVSALQSGLGWIVKLEKGDFVGRDALFEEKAAGVQMQLVGLEVFSGIARQGDLVFSEGTSCGVVTSGTKTPTVNKAIAFARVPASKSAVGEKLQISVRGKLLDACVLKTPFYKSLSVKS